MGPVLMHLAVQSAGVTTGRFGSGLIIQIVIRHASGLRTSEMRRLIGAQFLLQFGPLSRLKRVTGWLPASVC